MCLRYLVAWVALAALAGCGVETGAAAATAAAARKQELDQAQKTLEQSRQKIDQAREAQQQRLQGAE
jgi:cellobiose-specific phosphotransferase system component IIA